MLGDPFFDPHLAQIAALAVQHQLQSTCQWRSYVAAGCLMSYGFSQPDLGQRMAAYVDKILRGATPDDLPVEQPMRRCSLQMCIIVNMSGAGSTLYSP